jgi:uncharacterized protein (DUF433 family)
MATTAERITKTPGVCGGDACIRGTRITVWGLVNQRRLGAGDAEILRAVTGLTPADLEAAWEYAAVNAAEIHQAIRENEEGEDGVVRSGHLRAWSLRTLAVICIVYFGTFLVLSRWPDSGYGPGSRLWSFYRPPMGLVSLELLDKYRQYGRSPLEGWKRLEQLPASIFRPCIWLEELLTNRRYLPTYKGVVCFN